MKSIYERAIDAADSGCRVDVDIENRCLTINRRRVIANGKYVGESGKEVKSLEDTLSDIEVLFEKYRHSIPSESSERRRRGYFIPLKLEKLTDNDMMFGDGREKARVALELYVMLAIMDGSLYWNDESMGKWFWKSKKDSSLVILKKWVA